tara:strand:+ start:277 stop:543 length:267 start_codon:yes stop_codon:yes gene_type:complete
MTKPVKLVSPSKSYQMAELSDGEVLPLVVAGKDVEKVILGYSAKTAANHRCQKTGPPYFMVGARPYYLVKDLVEHFTKNPVKTFFGRG